VCITPQLLCRWERSHGTHWIGSWVSPSFGPDALEKRNISFPYRECSPSDCPELQRSDSPVSLKTETLRISEMMAVKEASPRNKRKRPSSSFWPQSIGNVPVRAARATNPRVARPVFRLHLVTKCKSRVGIPVF
jgi:hypothetical protein